jgi:BirA family transcriptional regulator, biotin operon repressor / biotin---[acetyl-CoA-carboxylase] ligase
VGLGDDESDSDFRTHGDRFPEPFRLTIRDTVGSTNDELRTLAQQGAADGRVLLAHRQTAGRGRRGAAWFAPAGESLAFSILVRPPEPRSLWPRLALAAGLAVAEAVERHVPLAGIKWPNDVWIGPRKVAGILVEAGADFAIVGIGLNVNTAAFPPELADTATSLQIEKGQHISRAEVLADVLGHFAMRRLQIDTDFPSLLAAIRVRCVLTGARVSLETAEGPRQGIVQGIGSGGELLLQTESGLLHLLQADAVRLL